MEYGERKIELFYSIRLMPENLQMTNKKTKQIVKVYIIPVIIIAILGCTFIFFMFFIVSWNDVLLARPPLDLSIKDANSTTEMIENNILFEKGEEIIELTQTNGEPIEWNELNIISTVQPYKKSIEMEVLSISGIPFQLRKISKTGDTILIGIKYESDNGLIKKNDIIHLDIYNKLHYVWTSPNDIEVL